MQTLAQVWYTPFQHLLFAGYPKSTMRFFGIELNWIGLVYIYESIYALCIHTVRGYCIKRGAERHYSHCTHTRTHTLRHTHRWIWVWVCVFVELRISLAAVMRCQNITISSQFLKCCTQNRLVSFGFCFCICICVSVSELGLSLNWLYQLSQVLSQCHLSLTLTLTWGINLQGGGCTAEQSFKIHL